MADELRAFLNTLDESGDCRTIRGADWNVEIGLITELQLMKPGQPALLFDEIKGYPPGYRVLANFLNTEERFALAFGLPRDELGIRLVENMRNLLARKYSPVAPEQVNRGKIEENVLLDDRVDMLKFPVPKWHRNDGGRYIGTGDVVIMKDPDTGWINLGVYRVQMYDRNRAAIHIVKGHHGDIIRQKYWDKGLGCPVAVVCGPDPLLYSVAGTSLCPQGVNDYEYVGWLRGRPVEVIQGRTVDLPIPAYAEIVLEGEILPCGSEQLDEGPFGEWEGYYAGGAFPETIFKVSCILHRNDPILVGQPPLVAANENTGYRNIIQAAGIWSELSADIPGVQGVWCPNEMQGLIMTVVSIKQMYHGHAKQVAMRVAGSKMSSLGRYIVVVDEDINPADISEVLWAMGTRCDPESSIDIIGGFAGMRSDPILHPDSKARNELYYSRAIIYACKPFSWIDRFPPTIKSDRDDLERTREKWGKILFGE